jgi:hypothetical protein
MKFDVGTVTKFDFRIIFLAFIELLITYLPTHTLHGAEYYL